MSTHLALIAPSELAYEDIVGELSFAAKEQSLTAKRFDDQLEIWDGRMNLILSLPEQFPKGWDYEEGEAESIRARFARTPQLIVIEYDTVELVRKVLLGLCEKHEFLIDDEQCHLWRSADFAKALRILGFNWLAIKPDPDYPHKLASPPAA